MRRLFVILTLTLAITTGRASQAATQSFEEALARAYQTNPVLQAARASLRATDEQVALANSGWRPSVNATAGIGSSDQKLAGNGMFSGSDTLSPRDAGITVTQPIFRGFRTSAAVDAAEAQVRVGRALLRNAEQQTLFEAAKAYLDVVQDQKVLELTGNNEKVLQEQLDATNSRFQIGEVTKTDISQSEARLNAATAQRVRAEGDLSNDIATFSRVVGDFPERLQQPKLTLLNPTSVDEAVALAEKNYPAVVAALNGHDAAKADVTAARGSLLPEINLVGSTSRAWDQSLLIPNRQDETTIMARITIPLYRAGSDYAKTRAAQQTTMQKRLELEDIRNRARELATRSWRDLQTARAAIKYHQSEVTAADLALHGVKEELKAGTRTTLDVLNADQELLNAKVHLVRAEHDETLAILQIKASVGDLTTSALNLSVDAYNPVEHYDDVHNKWIGFGE